MPAPRFFARLQSFAAGAAAVAARVLGGFFRKLRDFAVEARPKFRDVFDEFIAKIPQGKYRLVLAAAAGAFVVLVTLIITAVSLAGRNEPRPEEIPTVREVPPGAGIPPEDLFLPDEPDFVPGVMTEREKREQWTAADAAPFWYDPLKDGEEQWRELIEKTADEILEDVP